MQNEHGMAAYLWDLRAQLESKLRSVTLAQQALDQYARAASAATRAKKREQIVEYVTELMVRTKELRSAARDALSTAKRLG